MARKAERPDVLSPIVAAFKRDFPEDWKAIHLSPLEYGLRHMAEKLKG